MAAFTLRLSYEVCRTVLDKTGLNREYSFSLKWTPDPGQFCPEVHGLPPFAENPPPTIPDGRSIFTALREQLGLHLEAQRGPVEVLVIDSVEKPSDN